MELTQSKHRIIKNLNVTMPKLSELQLRILLLIAHQFEKVLSKKV